MSSCENCRRELGLFYCTGPFRFCSPMCRDTSKALREYEQMKRAEERLTKPTFLEQMDAVRDELTSQGINIRASDFLAVLRAHELEENCGVPNCAVCSGAMRERAGRGDLG